MPNVKKTVNAEKAEAVKERKREKRRLTLVILLIFLTFYIVLSLALTAIFAIYYKSGSKSHTLYSLTTVRYVQKTNGSYKRTILSTVDSDVANREYGLYIPFDDLNRMCDFSVAGNDDKLTVIVRGTDEYIEFFANSSFVYVNENPVRLSIPVLVGKSGYYIPMEFVEEYIVDLEVGYDEDDETCTVAIYEKKGPIGFKLKKQEFIPNVNITLEESGEVSEDVSGETSDETSETEE